MKISNIEINNYRNISNLNLNFSDINIIYGENAQGKTNLIEAIYLFSGAKSFRGVKDKELVKFNEKQANLKIKFNNNNREQEAEIIIQEKRSGKLNGIEKKSVCSFGEEIKAVVFSPVHLSMIKDGPNERRKFIDSALCQIKPKYRVLLKEYKRCLTQRNMLLKDICKNKSLEDMLYIWDKNLASVGAKIIFQRQKYIESLTPFAKKFFKGLSRGTEDISLKLIGKFDYENLSIEEIEKNLVFVFQKSRKIDILNKITTAGPHRDDLEILINNISARKFGSQGQQRSSVLALKLAEASLLREITNCTPIALLDDVMSELDENRQDYILNNISDMQLFITCCDANTILHLKEGKTFHIKNGELI